MMYGSYFAVDATPKKGEPLLCGKNEGAQSALFLRGFVFIPDDAPSFAICALDWVGLSTLGRQRLQSAIAAGIGTRIESITIHTLHFHDAPDSNLSCENLLIEYGLSHVAATRYDNSALIRLCEDAKAAAEQAVKKALVITHFGVSNANVHRVASNRRIIDENGKVAYTRYSVCRDKTIADQPEGIIDPKVDVCSFWSNNKLIATLGYYAVHPISNLHIGMCSTDFIGMAREMFTNLQTGAPHIQFTGAAGNITTGKYNNGDLHVRFQLSQRLYDGLKRAWSTNVKQPLMLADHRYYKLHLPSDERIDFDQLKRLLQTGTADVRTLIRAARVLSWRHWTRQNGGIDTMAVRFNLAWLLHMPGELFVEYQLYAKQRVPKRHVCMAAYGDCQSYIGLTRSYDEGGYETSLFNTLVSEHSEPIIKDHIDYMLQYR